MKNLFTRQTGFENEGRFLYEVGDGGKRETEQLPIRSATREELESFLKEFNKNPSYENPDRVDNSLSNVDNVIGELIALVEKGNISEKKLTEIKNKIIVVIYSRPEGITPQDIIKKLRTDYISTPNGLGENFDTDVYQKIIDEIEEEIGEGDFDFETPETRIWTEKVKTSTENLLADLNEEVSLSPSKKVVKPTQEKISVAEVEGTSSKEFTKTVEEEAASHFGNSAFSGFNPDQYA